MLRLLFASRSQIILTLLTLLFIGVAATSPLQAAIFDIQKFGATADDKSDDTLAIVKTLAACRDAGGGKIVIPKGTYIISRQGAESPILELPSNCTLCGEGAASILKFDARANKSNFWRMLGASNSDCRNVTIRDLHLDGSNTFKRYEKGKTPEQNHGIFLYRKQEGGAIENITVENCLIENFCGDCVSLSLGCKNITLKNIKLRNFIRQGIQMGGGNNAENYLVTGCQDLEGTVDSGGSTIHVEHARGLTGVIISNNHCRNSILAGGVTGITITDNVMHGRLVGNNNTNAIIKGNIIKGKESVRAIVQFGYTDGLIFKENIISSSHEKATGIYIWGTSRYNPAPSQNVILQDNLIRVKAIGIHLNGVKKGILKNNLISSIDREKQIVLKRTEEIQE